MKTKSSQITQTVQKHKELVLLFSIPLIIFVIALIAMTLPRFLMQPSYDFIYASCPTYSCTDRYIVTNGQLERDFIRSSGGASQDLYRYDTSNDSSQRISLIEAQSYQLDGSSRSPDGYNLSYERSQSAGLFLFYDSTGPQWQLQKQWGSRPVSLEGASWDIEHIGWVIE